MPLLMPFRDPLRSEDFRYRFEMFYHPFACDFIKLLNAGGIDGLLKWTSLNDQEASVQQEEKAKGFFHDDYQPFTPTVLEEYPRQTVDFSTDGAYSLYNWELFFHAPLLISMRRNVNQR